MNLKDIIKPAINALFFIVLLTALMPYISAIFVPTSTDETVDVIVATTPTPSNSKSAVSVTVTPTKKVPVRTPVPKVKVATCIITVNGSKYNVQALRSTHSGGNIFKCGTDMTAMFKSTHGSNYSLLAKYKM